MVCNSYCFSHSLNIGVFTLVLEIFNHVHVVGPKPRVPTATPGSSLWFMPGKTDVPPSRRRRRFPPIYLSSRLLFKLFERLTNMCPPPPPQYAVIGHWHNLLTLFIFLYLTHL